MTLYKSINNTKERERELNIPPMMGKVDQQLSRELGASFRQQASSK